MTDPLHPRRQSRHLTAASVAAVLEAAGNAESDPIKVALAELYEPWMCERIKEWAVELRFPEEWAAELGVPEAEMFNWISEFPDFARAYAVAITRLRAAYTSAMVSIAIGRQNPGVSLADAQPALMALIGKKRFADLYGDAPPDQSPFAWRGSTPRDVTPIDMRGEDVGALREEARRLRVRHETD